MRKSLLILTMVLTIVFIVGCNCKSHDGYTNAEKQNMATIEQMWSDWNNRDYEKMESHFADGFIYFSPYGNPKGMSREETKVAVEHLWSGNPDAQAEIVKLMADDNTVTQMLIMKGTNTGEFNGMPATNKEYTFGVISVFAFEDGKVKNIYESADFFGWMKQLGYMQ